MLNSLIKVILGEKRINLHDISFKNEGKDLKVLKK